MPLSPEIFPLLVKTIKESFKGKLCYRTETGAGWLAMFFRPGNKCLFLSCNEPYSGFCTASESEIIQLNRGEKRYSPFREIAMKHLVRFSLVDIQRIDSDRVISLHFKRFIGAGIDTNRTLVAELTGKRSNLHLIRDDGAILESIRVKKGKEESNRYNSPGKPYSAPAPFIGVDPLLCCDPSLFFSLEMLSGFGKNIGTRLKNSWHLYPYRSWVGYFREIQDYSSKDVDKKIFLQSINSHLSLFPVSIGKPVLPEGDILDFMREQIIIPLLKDRAMFKKRDLLKKIEKWSSKIASIRKGFENQIMQSEMANEYRIIGDLLLANSEKITRGSDNITLTHWSENGSKDIAITLDPSISVSKNAQKYFHKYKRFNIKKATIEEKMNKISSEESNIRLFSEMILTTEDPDKLDEISNEFGPVALTESKKSTHGPVKVFEFLGHQIIAGTNAKSNRKVTFVFASGDDIWFHAKKVPGGHVIVKNSSGFAIEKAVMEFAASLAAHFSKSGESEKINVDYTKRKYVRGVPGTLAEVTYSHANTINVSPFLWERMLSENQITRGGEQTGSS